MNTNYIDEKVTIWRRNYFEDGFDMKKLSSEIEENLKVGDTISDLEGWSESELLYDTEEELSLIDNGNQSTLEMYLEEGSDAIWTNEPTYTLSKTSQIKNVFLSMNIGDTLVKDTLIEKIWGSKPDYFKRSSFDVLKSKALKELLTEGSKINIKSRHKLILRKKDHE